MIWQISHMIFEIQVTLSEDPVKITRDRSGSDCVQSEIWLGLSALHQISYALGPRQPVVGTGH
jgi:hypothetical protein